MSEQPPDAGPWIDNHCHLEHGGRDGAPADPPGQVEAARAAGVVGLITVGTDASSSRRCLELAADLPAVWATAGVHPHDASEGTGQLREVVAEALDAGGPLVAIGECGLDYHYDHSPRDVQRRAFAEQVGLAHELGLPLVIHTREAWDDTFAILDSEGLPERTVFHCFTGGPQEATGALERGAFMSISGIVTFPSAEDLRSAVALAPLQRLMVETDSPFLTPVPYRGKPNSPALVGLVGAAVARVHDVEVATVASTTTATASAFYGIAPEVSG